MRLVHPVIEYEEKGLNKETIRRALERSLQGKSIRKALLIPPDITRAHSGAGLITALYYEILRSTGAQVNILPALGTHVPMTKAQLAAFFGAIPTDAFLVHRWRDGVTALGEIPRHIVREISEGLMDEAIPVQVSDYLTDSSLDIILSIGQVVPHEVVGMANYTKNIVVGCGGSGFINASHMLGAFYGIERILGQTDTPVRRLFDYAQSHFLDQLPLEYILTVTVTENEKTDIIGLYIGGGRKSFEQAAALSQARNIIYVDRPLRTCVVYLDEKEFHSAWLGNKAIYRARLAMADGGRLLILAPGIKSFGEDEENDRLIRKYGYVGRQQVLELLKTNPKLQNNLSAAAHLIHGGADGRFQISYAAPLLGREAVENVGYHYVELEEALLRYSPNQLRPGFNILSENEELYYIPNPALGLWKYKSRKK